VPPWAETVKALTARVRDGQFADDLQASLGAFWQSRQAEIERILARTEDLGRRLQESLPERVLCHADIHTANVLVTAAGGLFIVDWDQPIFAPKERDLMFVLGMPGADSSRAESMFFRGYGPTRANPLALAYYRYEWVVQEIGDFAARVFLSPNPGEATRQHAVEGFITLFAPGDVVEEAYQSDQI
jgi:spectinomycin phosphotransferase